MTTPSLMFRRSVPLMDNQQQKHTAMAAKDNYQIGAMKKHIEESKARLRTRPMEKFWRE